MVAFSLSKFAALFTLIGLAHALPSNVVTIDARTMQVTNETQTTRSLEKAQAGTVFFCTDINWGGNCFHFVNIPDNNICITMPSGFDNDISSFGPDSDLECFLYWDSACIGLPGERSEAIFNPGIADLRTIGFNDVVSSFKCLFLF